MITLMEIQAQQLSSGMNANQYMCVLAIMVAPMAMAATPTALPELMKAEKAHDPQHRVNIRKSR